MSPYTKKFYWVKVSHFVVFDVNELFHFSHLGFLPIMTHRDMDWNWLLFRIKKNWISENGKYKCFFVYTVQWSLMAIFIFSCLKYHIFFTEYVWIICWYHTYAATPLRLLLITFILWPCLVISGSSMSSFDLTSCDFRIPKPAAIFVSVWNTKHKD